MEFSIKWCLISSGSGGPSWKRTEILRTEKKKKINVRSRCLLPRVNWKSLLIWTTKLYLFRYEGRLLRKSRETEPCATRSHDTNTKETSNEKRRVPFSYRKRGDGPSSLCYRQTDGRNYSNERDSNDRSKKK